MRKTRIVETLQRSTEKIFAGFPVLFAYLFGSYATGIVHPFSDLDIAVSVGRCQEARERLDLEMSLSLRVDEAMGHVVQSDVREIYGLPLAIRGHIVTDGLLIYCRDNFARIEFETQTRMNYFDFHPFLDRYRTTRISNSSQEL